MPRLLRIKEGKLALNAAFYVDGRVAQAARRLDLSHVRADRLVALTYGAEDDPNVTEALYARWYVTQPPDLRYYAEAPVLVDFLIDQPNTIALHFTALLMRAVVTGRGLLSTLPEWRQHSEYCRLVPRLCEEFWRRLEHRPLDVAVLSIASLGGPDKPADAFAKIKAALGKSLPTAPSPWQLEDVLDGEIAQLVSTARGGAPGTAHLNAIRGFFGAALFTRTRQGTFNLYRDECVRARYESRTEVADALGQTQDRFPRLTFLKGQENALEEKLGRDGLRILQRIAAGQRDPVQIARDLGINTSRVDLVIRKAKHLGQFLSD